MIATSCADMIVWAKDRLVEDLAETIAESIGAGRLLERVERHIL
jgi:hypothetical protein